MYEFVIPARNEADRVGDVVRALKAGSGPGTYLVVVDNASADATAAAARWAGADRVVRAHRVGKGHAVAAGLRACSGRYVLLCDADVRGLDAATMTDLADRVHMRGLPLGRLALRRRPEDAPVTTLTARPLLAQLGVDAGSEPLGGLAAVDRRFARGLHLPGGWGFDVALTLGALAHAGQILELPAPQVSHRRRPLNDYLSMAEQVVSAILAARGLLRSSHDDCVWCEQPAERVESAPAPTPS